ncbi:MAG: PQQ-dependent sugar dehydrogenase [Proteobacteria bacterium]|nr:PQQ-dependent sugar dehydrogenase [Pseudomonadota bacterium]
MRKLLILTISSLLLIYATKLPEAKLLYQGSDVIWGFDFLEKDKIILAEKKGTIKILHINNGGIINVGNVPQVYVHGQGGLMDIAIHPEFKKNNLIYFSYAVQVDKFGETRISRAKLIDNKLENIETLFTTNSKSTREQHFGSRIVFDQKGHIFFSVGDRGDRNNAQKLDIAAGKIFRITEDGKIPEDNPFVKEKNAIGAIWAYGNRNPQGLFYDVTTNTLWEQEHGPRGGDEINIIQKGENYGWPVITFGREYYGPKIGTTHKDGMQQPVYQFTPSIAPSGLTMYKGNLYSGALVLTHLNRLILDGQKIIREERLLEKMNERFRDVGVGPDNLLYTSTDSGKIFQLKL